MKLRFAMLALPALLLAGCGDSSADDDERTASGEVLEGTISDGMLPLDTVTSQPPLVKAQPSAGASGEAADAAEEPEDAATLDAEQPVVENAVE